MAAVVCRFVCLLGRFSHSPEKGISFDLGARDTLLVYFFAGIGLNSDFRTLLKGGIPLLILLAATIGYMFIQNFTGLGMAGILGMEPAVGVLGGTTSLIGGHGTAIAWTPVFQERFGITERFGDWYRLCDVWSGAFFAYGWAHCQYSYHQTQA